jgi:transposase
MTNMKTAVDAIFVGKERLFNRRLLQMMSHYLVEPTPCTPGAAWEKGQIENQVKNLRKDLLVPRPRYKIVRGPQCVADGSVRRARQEAGASGVPG